MLSNVKTLTYIFIPNRIRFKYSNFLVVKTYSLKKTTIDDTENKKSIPKIDEKARSESECSNELSDLLESIDDKSQVLKAVAKEKAEDADCRSRLTKECGIISEKKISLRSSQLTPLNADHEDLTWEKLYLANERSKPCPPLARIKKPEESIISDKGGTRSPGDDGSSKTPQSQLRPIRGEPGKVHMACIPIEWFLFFVPKTGYTGFYTFLFTFGTYLVSKEYYVLEHNYYNGLSMFILWWGFIKYVGPYVSKYLDKEVDNYEAAWQKGRDDSKKALEDQISDELHQQYKAEGNLLLMSAKRENVAMQLEEEFRRRQLHVYEEVKKRLDYQVVIESVRQRIHQKNLVSYVRKEVMKSLSPELHDKIINISIEKLVEELNKSKKV